MAPNTIRPEDLRLVGDLMKDWIAPHLAPDSIHQIKQDQAALVPLMKVSKVCLNYLLGADFSHSTTIAHLPSIPTASPMTLRPSSLNPAGIPVGHSNKSDDSILFMPII